MSDANWSKMWFGETPYAEGLQLQDQSREMVLTQQRGIILGLEHPRVVTHGLRMENEPIPTDFDIPVFKTKRGGQATLHNIGQLVIYPIMPVKKWNWGVRDYVDLLLQTTAHFLETCNITIVSSNNGIYTENGKIASIGIHIKKGIAGHGIAINIHNDLSDFARIEACGVSRQPMDRVGNYRSIALPEAFNAWCGEFQALVEKREESALTSTSASL